MCGIIGYIGNNEKKQIILNGLKELEYRGYDSAGLAVLVQNEIHNFKAVGKIVNLENKCKDFSSAGFGIGIGHTRWATHGKPSESNAHPHFAEFSSVVHNGIIENYMQIKQELESSGHKFVSQTDTEVIVHLFEENLKAHKTPMQAFKKTIARLSGAYAILLITKAAPDSVFYAKKGSPLIIGKGEGANEGIYFSSSDAPLIGLAQRVCYLEDGAVGSIDSDGFENLQGIVALNATKSYAQKDGFRFFMEKEIYEQHKVLLETMMGRVSDEFIGFEEVEKEFFEGIDEITICACGTSYHAGLSAKYLLERESKIKCNVVFASEYRYAEPVMRKNELFVCVSQSGETADTLEALKLAKKHGLKSLAICNVDNSSIVRESDRCVLTRAGIEKGVASTKAFATQVMALWILSVYVGFVRGVIKKEAFKTYAQTMLKASKLTKVDSKLHDRLKRLSKRYLHGHGFFFIGRDVFYPLALEGALKLKEISYLHAEGYPSGEMKHGPIALADSELFCLALMPKHMLFEKIKSNVEELGARDSTICAICADEVEGADDMIYIPHTAHYMEEFYAMMVVLQLLALEISVKLGNDVDMPRNLAKSVTVE
ncbi:glutamine--fructose-6-phosphate transaminase (isomerizing) [Helicobacter sp. MIT 00-7814]|uniref:glutamine--fructose-6-phosphate transaminase (isomerizing) n=1 Tax=unclassified Helicobacter TaxID=2593540 RepID=UPI000E1F4135|nr:MULTISPECIES: glutamine--fructose-6-phosphate transaminase (isomerizing) [unclassified Helicobacter]RDU54789.1 glutamine--fructose-6-phosphate transaminase (isomerizing) [Helicobacter sp. MIT 99-10781]RDU54847.1 glutamine--fructose-6-phosphate transaminase (isomerizing) [Helicobacter sp. MIT 00-7814]